MNQNDIGRRHCQTYNFRAFLYFEGIYGISFSSPLLPSLFTFSCLVFFLTIHF